MNGNALQVWLSPTKFAEELKNSCCRQMTCTMLGDPGSWIGELENESGPASGGLKGRGAICNDPFSLTLPSLTSPSFVHHRIHFICFIFDKVTLFTNHFIFLNKYNNYFPLLHAHLALSGKKTHGNLSKVLKPKFLLNIHVDTSYMQQL